MLQKQRPRMSCQFPQDLSEQLHPYEKNTEQPRAITNSKPTLYHLCCERTEQGVLQLTIMHRIYCKLNCLLRKAICKDCHAHKVFYCWFFQVLKPHQNNINWMLPMPFYILKDIYTSLSNREKWPRLFASDGSLLFCNTHWKMHVNWSLTVMYSKPHKKIMECID